MALVVGWFQCSTSAISRHFAFLVGGSVPSRCSLLFSRPRMCSPRPTNLKAASPGFELLGTCGFSRPTCNGDSWASHRGGILGRPLFEYQVIAPCSLAQIDLSTLGFPQVHQSRFQAVARDVFQVIWLRPTEG